ncbi:MAG: FimB/Mfa2 family fimbrial subunit [Prevotella sp.]|nr:FimB/Mfa2 family fimbrial subunit [Prevotella sp.]
MNVRLILHRSLLAALCAVALSSCDMMTEDLDDCPTGLYVTFVYDYNIQRADMFKDHVGGLTLYVYDESDRMVASKTLAGSQLSHYGSYIHFTEQELAPDHSYRLMAVAFQSDVLSTTGAKYRLSGNNIGDQRNQFFVTLDHSTTRLQANHYYVSNAAPLDTLWHTLTTVVSPAEAQPLEVNPASLTPAKCEYSWQRDGTITSNGQETVSLVCGEPTYATVALIRDTKHLNITLRSIDNEKAEDNMVEDKDYTVEIIDNNSQLDCRNDLSNPADTLSYTPYQQWTTSFIGTDQVATESAAHYDLMFNRLVYKNASVTDDQYAILDEADIAKARNAVLLIRKQDKGEIIFGMNLPYILSSGRTYQERYYHYQEYLDREYDYRLQFILKGGRVEDIELYLGTEVHIIPWAIRRQNETLE